MSFTFIQRILSFFPELDFNLCNCLEKKEYRNYCKKKKDNLLKIK